jgi:hypothetical protein
VVKRIAWSRVGHGARRVGHETHRFSGRGEETAPLVRASNYLPGRCVPGLANVSVKSGQAQLARLPLRLMAVRVMPLAVPTLRSLPAGGEPLLNPKLPVGNLRHRRV